MYTEQDFVRIAKREKNQKRKYLVVNPLQGKHIPVDPREAFLAFRQLAECIRDAYENERLLLIGFAETATAIGAAVAIETGSAYIQTTREDIPGAEYLFFSEEHSHATEQKLVKDDIERAMRQTDRIVFIEDEITTGKTIRNMIRMLKQNYPEKLQFSAASLVNSMDENDRAVYQAQGIRLHYLVQTEHTGYDQIADACEGKGTYIPCNTACPQIAVTEFDIGCGMNARRLVQAAQYAQACTLLWHEIDRKIHRAFAGRVLVLGTEECMFPALFAANEIARLGADAVCHATTRSPILVGREPDYPLHVRYTLRSMYDPKRVTYVYDLEAYDTVLVITDAPKGETQGLYSLVNALQQKNRNIFIVRWYESEKLI